MEQIFEKATRQKLRFETARGHISTEDLWDLPLTGGRDGVDLDNVAKAVSKRLKETQEESFVSEVSSSNAELELKLEIAKAIIAVKKAEKAEKETSAAKAVIRKRLREELANRQDEKFKAMTAEEIEAELEKLG